MSSTSASSSASRKSLEPWLLDTIDFYPHQVDGVRTLARMTSWLLADEMGLGKSLQALTVFCVDIKMGLSETMIVVCPVTLKFNWYDEIKKFTRIPVVILGVDDPDAEKIKPLSPAQRKKQIDAYAAMTGPRILIVNYEQVTAHIEQLNKIHFDVRCFDEAHYLKNRSAKRTKASMKLRGKRTFLLTGSPMLNQVNELWTLLHMISPRDFANYWNFVQRYCVFGGYMNKQIIGVKNTPELINKLQNYQLRRLKKDVLNLKEPQIIQVKVDLHPDQRTLYDQVVNDMQLTMPSEPTPKDIENALTKFLRLKQICGTTATIEGYADHSHKLDRAVEIIAEQLENGERVVVFTQFRGVLSAIENRLADAVPNAPIYVLHGDVPKERRQAVVSEWGATTTPGVIVCMLQVAGIGLNMTQARVGVFLDKLFVPMLNKQAIDRLHRIGASETQPVQIYELLCRGTIETRIEAILRVKSKLFGSIVEEAKLKRRLVESLIGRASDEDSEEDE